MQGFFLKRKLLSCYSTRALQFTKQQVHLYGSQHEELRASYEDACLDPVSKFQTRATLHRICHFTVGRVLCTFIDWLKIWLLKMWYLDGVLSTIVKIIIVKIILVIDNLVYPEATDQQDTVYNKPRMLPLNGLHFGTLLKLFVALQFKVLIFWRDFYQILHLMQQNLEVYLNFFCLA